MIDINLIRENKEEVIKKLNTRGVDYTQKINDIYEKDTKLREIKKELDDLRRIKNLQSELYRLDKLLDNPEYKILEEVVEDLKRGKI